MRTHLLIFAILLTLATACTTTSNSDFYNTSVTSSGPTSTAGKTAGSPNSTSNTTINIRVTNNLRSRYNFYKLGTLKSSPQSEMLLKDFESVRQTEGWMSFLRALQLGDACVNSIADEPMLQWKNGGSILTSVNSARDAWRRAASFGIEPPKLSVGHIRFEEFGLSFHVHVLNSSQAVLLVRASRGQILGIFDLILANNGGQHVATHMLERVFVRPEAFLNTPWDDVMAQDCIKIRDVQASLDRIEGTITLQ